MWQVGGRGPDGEKQRRREEGSGCPRTRLHPSGGAHTAILEVLISYLFWETAGMLTSLECLRLPSL